MSSGVKNPSKPATIGVWTVAALAVVVTVVLGVLYATSEESSGVAVVADLSYVPSNLSGAQWLSTSGNAPLALEGTIVKSDAGYNGVSGKALSVATPVDLHLGGFSPFTVAYLVNGSNSQFSVEGYYTLRLQESRIVMKNPVDDSVVEIESGHLRRLTERRTRAASDYFMLCYAYTGDSLSVYIIQNSLITLVGVTQVITAIRSAPPGAPFSFTTPAGVGMFAAYIRKSVNLTGFLPAFQYVTSSSTSSDGGKKDDGLLYGTIAAGAVAAGTVAGGSYLVAKKK